MNVRHRYVEQLVLKAYTMLPYIDFPLNPELLIEQIPNCKYLTYQKFAEINQCSIKEVVQICESTSGCTHYDIAKDRYLIICNESAYCKMNPGRLRWTKSHEIGHVFCNHHSLSAYDKLSEHNFLNLADSEFESEADYFAATFLAPFPLYEELKIGTIGGIQNAFGLSTEAATYRYESYIRWKQHHVKASWEHDMVHIFREKYIF